MTYKKGDYLKHNDGECTMIRAVVEGGALVSRHWVNGDSNGYKAEQVTKVNRWVSSEQLDGYYTICTAEESGMKKRWRPEEGAKYFYGYVSSSLKLITDSCPWHNDYIDRGLLAVGNVHRTEEEALAFVNSKIKLL